MGLRLREGVDPQAIAERFGLADIVDWDRVDRLVGSAHLERSGARIRLTAAGRLVLDHILGEIVARDDARITDVAAKPEWRPEALAEPAQPLLAAS